MQELRTGGRAAGRSGWAFRALVLCATLVIPAMPLLHIQAKAAGHRHTADNQYFIPPPPPTPVLTPAPPPVELPYSYAYSNFQPSIKAVKPTPARVLPPASHVASVTSPNLSLSIARSKGFGVPRETYAIAPGGAQAMPFVAPHTGNPWFDSCLSWYTVHNMQQQAGFAPVQPAGYLGGSFYPVYPASFEQQATAQMLSAAPSEPGPTIGTEKRFTPPTHHTDFRHRKHVRIAR